MKKLSSTKAIFYLALVLFFAGTLTAQSKFLTMEEAINSALEKNNLIKAGEYAVEKAFWDKNRAWTALFPKVSFNTRYTRIDDQTFFERDFRQFLPPELAKEIPQTVFQESYYSSFDFSIPLFDGILLNGISIATANKEAAERNNQSTRQNIIFQVVAGYLNVLKSKEILELQKEYLDLSKLNYDKAERMYNANRYSKNEVLRWKVEYEQQKSNVVTSQSNLRTAVTGLSRLMNKEIKIDVDFEVSLPAVLNFEAKKLMAFNNEALLDMIELSKEELIKVNDALAAIKAGTEVSRLLYKNTYSNYLPKIDLTYSYGWRENGSIELDDYSPKTLRVNFSLPIFTSFQNYTELKSSYFEYKEKEEQFNNQIQNTRYVLVETMNRLLNLKTQKTLAKSSLSLSESNYKVVESRKERELVSNIEFIDAKLNYQDAKINLTSVDYDFISTMLELYYMLGRVESLVK